MKKTPSNSLGIALLLLVAIVHYSYDPIAHLFFADEALRAKRAIFYIARGVEGAALWAAVWFRGPRSFALGLACAWGFTESAQTSICRLAAGGIGAPAPTPAAWGGMCDVGFSLTALTAIIVLLGVSIVQVSRDK